MDYKIKIEAFKFFYGREQVINGIDLNIPKNGIFSLLGPAKSGITTMLRAVNRLSDIVPGARMEGSILLDGKNINDADVNVAELRRRVGIVFDVPAPLPMSVYENVAFGPKLLKKGKAEIRALVEESLQTAALWDDVKDRLNTPAQSLSGGQQQRLCIARVLALKPEVILLDRPCSGLDPISTAKIEESLIQLKELYTIVIAPHNVQQAVRISDRAAFMLSGDLIEEGANTEIFSNPVHKRTSDYITGRFG
ncbi:MAG: phosphate ABC transporter ATP-binding protein [Defluviitaleaceae bacterium]|nr:phosphate ABC transporter ATP-binding protein [Defluviitaleaceae bacterium]